LIADRKVNKIGSFDARQGGDLKAHASDDDHCDISKGPDIARRHPQPQKKKTSPSFRGWSRKETDLEPDPRGTFLVRPPPEARAPNDQGLRSLKTSLRNPGVLGTLKRMSARETTLSLHRLLSDRANATGPLRETHASEMCSNHLGGKSTPRSPNGQSLAKKRDEADLRQAGLAVRRDEQPEVSQA